MLPASEYSLARWKKTSTNRSSSRMATLVSWRFAEITNSLLMKTPVPGENGASSKRRAFRCQALRRVIQWTVYPVCHDHKSLDLVRRRCDSLTPFEAFDQTTRQNRSHGRGSVTLKSITDF